ncbi:hypothetical protein HDG38_006821 [Paraburkholderia sp. WSM4177]|nr:hypothetical protein [Paraburkholderia sp. WSM4177]MBB5483674.1 hypothetical protein [Paraburkholderia sp. WSM4180]
MLGSGSGVAIVLHLRFANHVHHLDAGQNDARTPETLEAHDRLDDTFDGAVILLDDVVQILI